MALLVVLAGVAPVAVRSLAEEAVLEEALEEGAVEEALDEALELARMHISEPTRSRRRLD